MLIAIGCLQASLIVLGCFVNGHYFLRAISTYRSIVRSGENHGAREWTRSRVEAKSLLLVIQATSLASIGYHLFLLAMVVPPARSWHFAMMGFPWCAVSILAVLVARANSRMPK